MCFFQVCKDFSKNKEINKYVYIYIQTETKIQTYQKSLKSHWPEFLSCWPEFLICQGALHSHPIYPKSRGNENGNLVWTSCSDFYITNPRPPLSQTPRTTDSTRILNKSTRYKVYIVFLTFQIVPRSPSPKFSGWGSMTHFYHCKWSLTFNHSTNTE